MFRTAELGRKVSKTDFKKEETVLRQELLEVQQAQRVDGSFPVIIVFAGVDGAGKGDTTACDPQAVGAQRWQPDRALRAAGVASA